RRRPTAPGPERRRAAPAETGPERHLHSQPTRTPAATCTFAHIGREVDENPTARSRRRLAARRRTPAPGPRERRPARRPVRAFARTPHRRPARTPDRRRGTRRPTRTPPAPRTREDAVPRTRSTDHRPPSGDVPHRRAHRERAPPHTRETRPAAPSPNPRIERR